MIMIAISGRRELWHGISDGEVLSLLYRLRVVRILSPVDKCLLWACRQVVIVDPAE
jgi:hypothetical protein